MAAHFEVTVVLDESGSMDRNIEGALDGVNGFLATLREQPTHLRVSLLKFSGKAEYVYRRSYLAEVRNLTVEDYRPHGGTLLYDSVLATVADMEPAVEAHKVHAVVVIVTDGDDTESTASMEEVAEVVKAKTATERWTFLYFGPGGQVGTGMGIPKDKVFTLVPGSSEEIKAAFEVAAEETVKLLSAGSGVFNL